MAETKGEHSGASQSRGSFSYCYGLRVIVLEQLALTLSGTQVI